MGTIFCSSQFTPKPALFLYTYAIIQEVLIIFLFYVIKGAVLISNLRFIQRELINSIEFVWWGQFIMMTTYCHTK